MSQLSEVERLLQYEFDARNTKSAVKHFRTMVGEFQVGAWEAAIQKGGQFVEAALKAIHVAAALGPPPAGRNFKVDVVINKLGSIPGGSVDDSLRLTIPRACRFVYDIASNRGARHDPQEIDPNEMDARVVVSVSSWVLAEALRFSQKGSVDPAEAARLVDGLTQRKYPLIEEIDGRVYFHLKGASARDIALLTLWHRHPERVTREHLIASIVRHRFKSTNAKMALSRILDSVDEDEDGKLLLLQTGIGKAEALIGQIPE